MASNSTYKSNHSVYSHGRSSTNLASQKSRSMKSVKVPWYQKPILHNNKYINVQKSAMFAALFSIFVSIFTICTAAFDIYSLGMAAPGSTHYGYYFISYEFVYVGNSHIRNALIMFAFFSLIGGVTILVTGIMLVVALRKEYEHRIVPWLWTFAVFTIIRFMAFLFFAIVNDLIFAYNILMVLLWIALLTGCAYSWLIIYSLYLELADLTKLEDLAHLRMGTMASIHGSTNPSIAGSRPTTPYTTVSTIH